MPEALASGAARFRRRSRRRPRHPVELREVPRRTRRLRRCPVRPLRSLRRTRRSSKRSRMPSPRDRRRIRRVSGTAGMPTSTVAPATPTGPERAGTRFGRPGQHTDVDAGQDGEHEDVGDRAAVHPPATRVAVAGARGPRLGTHGPTLRGPPFRDGCGGGVVHGSASSRSYRRSGTSQVSATAA